LRLLLDSHVLVWWMDQHDRLNARAFSAIEDRSNQILVSAATIWELGIKVGLGKLDLRTPIGVWTAAALADLDAEVLPITPDYVEALVSLPHHHKDPFDRMIVAQALAEGIPIVSSDAKLDSYGLRRIW
jgi:PIN domain nuclease of toxin-antitoxin system